MKTSPVSGIKLDSSSSTPMLSFIRVRIVYSFAFRKKRLDASDSAGRKWDAGLDVMTYSGIQ